MLVLVRVLVLVLAVEGAVEEERRDLEVVEEGAHLQVEVREHLQAEAEVLLPVVEVVVLLPVAEEGLLEEAAYPVENPVEEMPPGAAGPKAAILEVSIRWVVLGA